MASKRVLVVEDEPDLLRAISIALRRAGHAVVAARTPAHALDNIVKAHSLNAPFDLVIAELPSPSVESLGFVDHLLSLGIPVTFGVITSYGSSGVRERLVDKGCVFCLDKPFNAESLQRCVDGTMEESGTADSAAVGTGASRQHTSPAASNA